MTQSKQLHAHKNQSARLTGTRWKLWMTFAVGILMACTMLNFAVGAAKRKVAPASATGPPKATSSKLAATPRSAASGDRLEVETIILTRFGFEPEQIIRPPGEFLLNVLNRSQVSDVDLRLDKSAGDHVRLQHVSQDKLDWRDFFTLEPGDYVLTEASHPEWVCRITITPQ